MGEPTQTDSRSALIRRLAIASIAGQLAWLAIAIVAGLLEPSYSEIRDAVSVLGAREGAQDERKDQPDQGKTVGTIS